MKLNSTQVKQTLSQFDAEVLSDSHPAVPQLNDLFGDHTFFLDGSGLNVLEPLKCRKWKFKRVKLSVLPAGVMRP
jgi:hypothetical protein